MQQVFPFDSARKRMTTVIRLKNGRYRVFVKGASEIILALCTHRQTPEGKAVPLTEQDHVRMMMMIDDDDDDDDR